MQFQKVYNDTLLIAASGTTPIPLDWRGGNGALNIVVTGTVNYDLQQTFDDIQFKTAPFTWSVDDAATQAAQTAGQTVLYRAHPKAIRLYVNSITAGATITLSYTQQND
jgi:hypothetical protein